MSDMSDKQQFYLTLAYVISLGLLWGYALSLWIGARSIRNREQRRQ